MWFLLSQNGCECRWRPRLDHPPFGGCNPPWIQDSNRTPEHFRQNSSFRDHWRSDSRNRRLQGGNCRRFSQSNVDRKFTVPEQSRLWPDGVSTRRNSHFAVQKRKDKTLPDRTTLSPSKQEGGQGLHQPGGAINSSLTGPNNPAGIKVV